MNACWPRCTRITDSGRSSSTGMMRWRTPSRYSTRSRLVASAWSNSGWSRLVSGTPSRESPALFVAIERDGIEVPARPVRGCARAGENGSVNLDYHIMRFDWAGGPPRIGPGVADLAERAEAMGVRTVSFMDHFFQMDWMAPAEDPMLEGYTALGFVAGRTERLRLRLLVTGVTYRHP